MKRLILDTNILVSAVLRFGLPHQVLLKARGEGILLASEETLAEFHEVLLRPKFDPYIERAIRKGIVAEYARNCTVISIPSPIRACRDPRDDKFLKVAAHGRADAIVTGDRDVLALHPFLGIEILTPADYLKKK